MTISRSIRTYISSSLLGKRIITRGQWSVFSGRRQWSVFGGRRQWSVFGGRRQWSVFSGRCSVVTVSGRCSVAIVPLIRDDHRVPAHADGDPADIESLVVQYARYFLSFGLP